MEVKLKMQLNLYVTRTKLSNVCVKKPSCSFPLCFFRNKNQRKSRLAVFLQVILPGS